MKTRALPALAVTAVAVALGIRLFKFISDYSVNVLFFDQWDFLGPLFRGNASLGELFFYQHGPHREGLGLIADYYLYPLTDWNVRAESFLIGACVFAAMLLALLLKYRLFGRLSYGDVAIPLIFLTMAQYETFIGTPNAAYSAIPLLLILLYCLALTVKRYHLRYALCLLLNFLLIFTGFGLFMGAVTIGVFAVECYRRLRNVGEIPLGWPIGGMSVAAASLALFFIHYTFQPADSCFVFPNPDLAGYPRFVALMVAKFFGVVSPFRLAEAVGLAGILIALAMLAHLASKLVKEKSLRNMHLVPAVLLTYSTLFALNTAIGRACLGPDAARTARYATLLIPGVTAFYLYLQSLTSPGIRRALTATFILLLIPGCLIVDSAADWFAEGKRAWVDCYIRTGNIPGCDKATGFAIYPNPEQTRLKEKLDYLKARRLNLFSRE
jgi:hypothetical protein